MKDKVAVCVWPDETWCFQDDIEEYSWKSDDYIIYHVPDELSDEDIDALVTKLNK